MSDREFSLYDVEQFLREAGAERVTEDAVLNLERELAKLADKVTNKAIRYAAHAGRTKLIRREDILLTRVQRQFCLQQTCELEQEGQDNEHYLKGAQIEVTSLSVAFLNIFITT